MRSSFAISSLALVALTCVEASSNASKSSESEQDGPLTKEQYKQVLRSLGDTSSISAELRRFHGWSDSNDFASKNSESKKDAEKSKSEDSKTPTETESKTGQAEFSSSGTKSSSSVDMDGQKKGDVTRSREGTDLKEQHPKADASKGTSAASKTEKKKENQSSSGKNQNKGKNNVTKTEESKQDDRGAGTFKRPTNAEREKKLLEREAELEKKRLEMEAQLDKKEIEKAKKEKAKKVKARKTDKKKRNKKYKRSSSSSSDSDSSASRGSSKRHRRHRGDRRKRRGRKNKSDSSSVSSAPSSTFSSHSTKYSSFSSYSSSDSFDSDADKYTPPNRYSQEYSSASTISSEAMSWSRRSGTGPVSADNAEIESQANLNSFTDDEKEEDVQPRLLQARRIEPNLKPAMAESKRVHVKAEDDVDPDTNASRVVTASCALIVFCTLAIFV